MNNNAWMKEKVEMTYDELFNHIASNEFFIENFNENKIAEIVWNIIYSLYRDINNNSPYEKLIPMKKIQYINHDATYPIGDSHKYILHICNNVGGWGKGFVNAISKRWPEPKSSYKAWYKNGFYTDRDSAYVKFQLGENQYVDVTDNITVVNMIAQEGIYPKVDENGKITQPIRYDALKLCLNSFVDHVKSEKGFTANMPLIGSGLAGGDWNIIEKIINSTLIENGIDTFVYVLKNENKN